MEFMINTVKTTNSARIGPGRVIDVKPQLKGEPKYSRAVSRCLSVGAFGYGGFLYLDHSDLGS